MHRRLFLAACISAGVLTAPAVAADIGTVAVGELYAREKPDSPWRSILAKGAVKAGERLVALAPVSVDAKNVRVTLLPDLAREPGTQAFESVARLDAGAEGTDLTVSVERGRVDFLNRSEKGSATVRLKFREETWDIVLEKPGGRVAVELVGRWPVGTRFKKEPAKEDTPISDLFLVVRQGPVTVKEGGSAFGLAEPPGPALFHWDSLAGTDSGPVRLERLPPWAAGEPTAPSKDSRTVLDKLNAALVTGKSGTESLLVAAGSTEATTRSTGLIALGALDDLAGLHDALTNAKSPATREATVPVLRHWIGTGPGQDQVLYKALQEKRGYKPVQAGIVLQLLHGFSTEDLKRQETYEALVAYLEHDKPAVRELAAWQLSRLTSAGKDIKYDSTAPEAERAKAAAAWRKLLDDGKLR